MMKEYCVIIHSGVKNQKHGVRRYQNPDGTYTELGKERRRVGFGSAIKTRIDKYKEGAPERAAKRAEKKAERDTKRTEKQAVRDAKKAERDAKRMPKNPRKLSDAELKAKTERLIAESQYKVLMDPDHYKIDPNSKAAVKIQDPKKPGAMAIFTDKLVNQLSNDASQRLSRKIVDGIFGDPNAPKKKDTNANTDQKPGATTTDTSGGAKKDPTPPPPSDEDYFRSAYGYPHDDSTILRLGSGVTGKRKRRKKKK